jgi:hypothetical protein
MGTGFLNRIGRYVFGYDAVESKNRRQAPAGRLRFYRQDTDGNLEFSGESEINHTPRDETIQAFTGSHRFVLDYLMEGA